MSEEASAPHRIARGFSVDWAAFAVAIVLAALARLGVLGGVPW